MHPAVTLGRYDKERASALKISSGNYPGHGKIPPPPPGARTGYGIFNRDKKWIGFVELTRPFRKQKVYANRKAAYVGVGVLPEYRGKGIANTAVAELLQRHPEVKKWWWQALDTNEPSKGLGKKLGFSGEYKKGKYSNMEKTAAPLLPVKFPRTTKLLASMSPKGPASAWRQ